MQNKPPYKENPTYFEGVLQLRNPNKEVISFIYNEFKKNKKAFISKERKLTNGYDYYVSSNKFLMKLGKKLQNTFGGELKKSARLFTRNRQTSKEVYRLTVLFRLPEFNRGDVISYKGEKLKIINFGKKIFAKSIKTGKKYNINYKDLA